jgi:hypothetical protein
MSDGAVITALITGCTTVAVAGINAAARVVVAWIRVSHGQPPREIEPPDP